MVIVIKIQMEKQQFCEETQSYFSWEEEREVAMKVGNLLTEEQDKDILSIKDRQHLITLARAYCLTMDRGPTYPNYNALFKYQQKMRRLPRQNQEWRIFYYEVSHQVQNTEVLLSYQTGIYYSGSQMVQVFESIDENNLWQVLTKPRYFSIEFCGFSKEVLALETSRLVALGQKFERMLNIASGFWEDFARSARHFYKRERQYLGSQEIIKSRKARHLPKVSVFTAIGRGIANMFTWTRTPQDSAGHHKKIDPEGETLFEASWTSD